VRALVFDFDGVIADSAREAFLIASQTLGELLPDHAGVAFLPSCEEVARAGGSDLAEHPLFAAFVAVMPLGNRPGDFAVALLAILAGAELADQASHDAFRSRQDPALLGRFSRRFFEVRHAFAAAHPGVWRALQRPYPEVVALIRRHAVELPMAIATAKDRPSVQALLEDYGLARQLPGERVLDKENGASKAAHLERIHALLDVPYPEVTFLDDKVSHLRGVAGLGVRCGLATWGYNSRRERREARDAGYLVCTLADLEAQLFTGG
jgi:phosphoglycolate phosphatase-like HAD superfamily hydrolase